MPVRQAACLEDLLEQQRGGLSVAAGPVPVGDADAKIGADIAQAIAGGAGEGLPAETDRAKFLDVQVQTAGFQLMFDKGVIEVDIVSDKDSAREPFMNNIRYFIEIRGVGNHFVIDPGEGLDIPGDGHPRIYKGLIPLKFPHSIV